MNPDNNSLKRTIFIGGPPRVGKTLIAHEIASTINGHLVSTDWIRNAVKRSHPDRKGNLFIFDDLPKMSLEEFVILYTSNTDQLMKRFSTQATALWPSIVSLCSSFTDDDFMHVVEGVAIEPRLVASMQHQPDTVLFIGNTNPDHVSEILRYSAEHSNHDWMTALGYSDIKKKAVAQATLQMSEYFKDESSRFGFRYIELRDFEVEKSKLVAELVGKFSTAAT